MQVGLAYEINHQRPNNGMNCIENKSMILISTIGHIAQPHLLAADLTTLQHPLRFSPSPVPYFKAAILSSYEKPTHSDGQKPCMAVVSGVEPDLHVQNML